MRPPGVDHPPAGDTNGRPPPPACRAREDREIESWLGELRGTAPAGRAPPPHDRRRTPPAMPDQRRGSDPARSRATSRRPRFPRWRPRRHGGRTQRPQMPSATTADPPTTHDARTQDAEKRPRSSTPAETKKSRKRRGRRRERAGSAARVRAAGCLVRFAVRACVLVTSSRLGLSDDRTASSDSWAASFGRGISGEQHPHRAVAGTRPSAPQAARRRCRPARRPPRSPAPPPAGGSTPRGPSPAAAAHGLRVAARR